MSDDYLERLELAKRDRLTAIIELVMTALALAVGGLVAWWFS